jgi:putative ABC transport system permease protein
MLGMIRANLARRWGRTALTCLGIAFGVTTVVALLAVTSGLSRSAGDLARLGRADFGVFQSGVTDLTASSLPGSAVPRIGAVHGVASVSPIQIVPNAISSNSSILLFGSPPGSYLTKRLVLVAGRPPRGDELFVGSDAARRLRVRPGAVLNVAGQPFVVAGIYRSGIALEDSGLVLPLATTQRLSNRGTEVSMVAVSIEPGYRERDVERAVQQTIPGTLALGDPGEVNRVDTNSRVISKAAIIIAVLALLLGAVVVVNTMAMAMIERRREFGVLTAVGWSRARIARLILGETMAVSLAGALIGLALGALASQLVVRALAAATFVTPEVNLWVLARGLLVGFALGVIGALFCVSQVMRVPLLRAINR